TVATPDGRSDPVRLAREEGVGVLRYEATDVSGPYQVHLGPPVAETHTFAVNVDPEESDLTKLQRDELAHELLPDVEFAYLTQWQNPEETPQAPVRHRGDLHHLLLYGVLGLLLAESVLAWRFGHYATS
ncbi:MAG: hypothetical protein ACOC46_04675, partial [Pirellulales bacterium]